MTSDMLAVDAYKSIRMLWARRWALVAVVVLASAAGYLVARALPVVWESQAVVQIGQVGATPAEFLLLSTRLNDERARRPFDDALGANAGRRITPATP